MGNHRVTHIDVGNGMHEARCTCRRRSPIASKIEVDFWEAAHMNEVERLRAQLRTSNPSLSAERDWYQLQADNPENSDTDRRLWQQLANELGHRLGDDAPELADDALF